MLNIEIGEKIKNARKSWGLSQIELAERLGISFQQIQKYEKGSTRISVVRLFQISKALGIDISHFFEGEENPLNLSDASIKYIADRDDLSNLQPLNKEEVMLLKLFRKIGNKKLKKCVFNHLKGIVEIENMKY